MWINVCSKVVLLTLVVGSRLTVALDRPDVARHICSPKGHVLDPESLQHGEKLRRFEFRYGGRFQSLESGQSIRVWLPVPSSTSHQLIQLESANLPTKSQTTRDEKFGNCMLYFETQVPGDGSLEFELTFDVTRAEVKGLVKATSALAAAERMQFLKPNRLVPITGKPLDLLRAVQLPKTPLELGRALYDRVGEHMAYDKSRPGYGNGDSVWACDSRFGNCTDFHSLFISLARAKGLPARFEIGFPIPEERGTGTIGGYHCWALFHSAKHGWVPADISEADKHPELKDYYFGNLTENRVMFSRGRDIDLVPQQAGQPLNFFVYPYAEVDGRPVNKANIATRFSWRDQ
ncbi:MAG: transglutaminase-like domain-containing protein [Planctomycetota bacterium]|jgi:transglutaminase-like putative cysteine protease